MSDVEVRSARENHAALGAAILAGDILIVGWSGDLVQGSS
jgi:hypothetical protein